MITRPAKGYLVVVDAFVLMFDVCVCVCVCFVDYMHILMHLHLHINYSAMLKILPYQCDVCDVVLCCFAFDPFKGHDALDICVLDCPIRFSLITVVVHNITIISRNMLIQFELLEPCFVLFQLLSFQHFCRVFLFKCVFIAYQVRKGWFSL